MHGEIEGILKVLHDGDVRYLTVDLGETRANVVGLEDLIALKREAGRPQDLADIEALNAIRLQGGGAS